MMIANQSDLKNLNDTLERVKREIEQLGKFKDECGAHLFAFVSQVKRKMTALEK